MYTDLEQAGFLTDGPLLYRFNDARYRWIAQLDWLYHLQFNGMSLPLSLCHRFCESIFHCTFCLLRFFYLAPLVDDSFVTQPVFLVLHGVDTVADVTLNGYHLGSTDNMFVRYRFDVRNILQVITRRFSSEP